MEGFGSTGSVRTVQEGVVLKKQWDFRTDVSIRETARSFSVEKGILESLKSHPTIVRYVGTDDDGVSFLLGKAFRGCLQDYLDTRHSEMPPSLTRRWQRQAAEALAYIHSHDVIHPLRPPPLRLWRLLLRAARCRRQGPALTAVVAPAGRHGARPRTGHLRPRTVLYSLEVGRLPFRDRAGRLRERAERGEYEADVEAGFGRGEFPDLSALLVGYVVRGCWSGRFVGAEDALEALGKD